MKYIQLNNGLKMPMLGLGMHEVGDYKECKNIVKEALNLGYRSIDTAKIYGNENAIGDAIKESGVPRNEIFLTTKIWNEDQRNSNVRNAFEKSLRNLGTDYIDLYLIHWPVSDKFIETWLELERIYKTGKVKAIGISNFNEHHLDKLKNIWNVVPAVNQIELHPRLTQKKLMEYCKDLNICVESWSPLGAKKNDLLSNKTLSLLGKKYEKTIAQIILRWNIDLNIITIPKTSKIDRLKENIDIFDFELELNEIDLIDKINKNERVGPDPDNFNF